MGQFLALLFGLTFCALQAPEIKSNIVQMCAGEWTGQQLDEKDLKHGTGVALGILAEVCISWHSWSVTSLNGRGQTLSNRITLLYDIF
eukprot:1144019-Pelagomonas_calceolata.AAC.3